MPGLPPFVGSILCAALSGILCLTSGAIPASAESVEQEFLTIGNLTKNGRPADFFRSVLETEPSVCREILSSLNLGMSETELPSKRVGNLLLASRLSVRWHVLKHPHGSRALKFYRVDLDLNGDGAKETIYRRDAFWGRFFPQSLFWVERAPADEREITLQRDKDIQGAYITIWEGGYPASENQILIQNGFVDADGKQLRQTIYPPLPEGLVLPHGSSGRAREGGSFYDIALLNGRAFVLKASARYHEEPGKPKVFVFSSQGLRKHKLECLFEGRYEIRSRRRVRRLQ